MYVTFDSLFVIHKSYLLRAGDYSMALLPLRGTGSFYRHRYCTRYGVWMRKNIDELFEEFLQEWEFTRKTKDSTLRGFVQCVRHFKNIVPDLTIELITVKTITIFFKTLEQRKRIVGKKVKTGIKSTTARTY